MTDRQAVIDALTKPFPRQAIKQNQGRDYVSGTSVIYRLNAATNYDWEFEITGHELVGGEDSQGNKPAQVVYGRMRIPIVSNGWRADMGTQALENSKDDHEAYKGAATDCMKRCARQFGVGLHLWGEDIEAGELPQRQAPVQRSQPQAHPAPQQGGDRIAVGGMTDQQRKMIWAVATKEKGMTDADIEGLCQEMFGVELKALDKPQASQLIDRLKGSEPEASPHPMVQQAIDNREANYLAAIEGAGSIGELRKVGEQIAGAGIKSDALTAAYKRQKAMLEERAA